LNSQCSCFGLLHVFWAACLMTLVVLGLLDLPWNGAYIGGDLLWMAVLFFSTGALGSTNLSLMTTTRFVLSVVSLAVAVEKMCVSINDLYQAATFPAYVNGIRQIYVGQVVLYAVQLGILTAEAVTSLATATIFGRIISTHYSTNTKNSTGSSISALFSFGVLFYGIVLVGCYVLFELGKWRYSEVPTEIYFYRLGNGPVAAAVFIVQVGYYFKYYRWDITLSFSEQILFFGLLVSRFNHGRAL
uniref:RTA1 like protein n=1 Tax=Toxocara canis TaxID=6265 RepID=A0A183U434_TOXCA